MKKILLLAVIFSCVVAASEYTNKDNVNRMHQLSFLVGQWQGSGWMIGPDQSRHSFDQTEHIQFKLNDTVLMIEGKGLDQTDSQVIHHALALVNWENDKQEYRFVSTLANGRSGLFKAKINEQGQFVWWMDSTQGTRRFVIELNEKGQWYEVGEFSKDGEQWFQFFEMTLDKLPVKHP